MQILPIHLIALCLSFTGEMVVPPCISWMESIEYLVTDPTLYVDWLINHHGGVDNALMNCVSMPRYTGVVRGLLARGADVHANNDRALIDAVRNECVETVHMLIKAGADVDTMDGAPLMRASENGFDEIVQALIDAGADVNGYEDVPLTAAAQEGHLKTVHTLLNAGANVNPGHGEILAYAARAGHVDIVRVLIDAGADVNTDTYGQDCALMQAAWEGHIDVVNVLIDAGANANDYTAINGAAMYGHTDVLRALLAAGADVHHLHQYEYMQIAREGHMGVLEVLMRVDNRFNMFVDAMIMAAAKNCQVDMTRVLCSHKLKSTLM